MDKERIRPVVICLFRRGERILVYDAEFTDKSLYERGELQACESEIDKRFNASWRTPEEIERRGVRLVPEPLADALAEWASR